MNYIVFDTEFNQPMFFGGRKFIPNPIAPFEIIEIGCVKLDENLNVVDTFSALVKPKIYKTLSPLVIRKTKIKKDDLKNASFFLEVFKNFKRWIGSEYILCTWGDSDIIEMKRNCRFHHISDCCLDNFIDIQKVYAFKQGLPAGQQTGLKNALSQYDVVPTEKLHRALNDAQYTALIFQKIYDEKLVNEYKENISELKKKMKRIKKRAMNKKRRLAKQGNKAVLLAEDNEIKMNA